MVLIGECLRRTEYFACSMVIDQLRLFLLLTVQVCLHQPMQRKSFESNSTFTLALTSIRYFNSVIIQVYFKLYFPFANKDYREFL